MTDSFTEPQYTGAELTMKFLLTFFIRLSVSFVLGGPICVFPNHLFLNVWTVCVGGFYAWWDFFLAA